MSITLNGEPQEPGCYIGGHIGQYGLASLVEMVDKVLGTAFAGEFPKDQDGKLAGAYGGAGPWDIGNAHTEACVEVADKAEAALNAATVGGYWRWVDGEFFLCPDGDEDDE